MFILGGLLFAASIHCAQTSGNTTQNNHNKS